MTLVRDNKYIPSEDKDFFILLRIGLWQKVEEELSPNPDWEYIYKLATEQTVQGIITDGIGLYRKQYPDLNITQEQNERFLNITAQIIKRNYAVNQLQARICQLFDNPSRINELFPNTANETAISESALSLRGKVGIEAPIHYVILKGQAVAQCYPKPYLRCSGDIDYLVHSDGVDDYDRARKLVGDISHNVHQEMERMKHSSFTVGDIEVEVHGTTKSLISSKLDEAVEKERKNMFLTSNIRTISIAGTDVNTPSLEYHAIFLVSHLIKHMINSAVGLRQFCDLALFVTSNKETIDCNKLSNLLSEANAQKQWNILFSFIQYYLSSDDLNTLGTSKKYTWMNGYCNRIWANMKRFGYGDRHTEESNNKKSTLSTLQENHHRFMMEWRIAPMRAIKRDILFYMNHFVKLLSIRS